MRARRAGIGSKTAAWGRRLVGSLLLVGLSITTLQIIRGVGAAAGEGGRPFPVVKPGTHPGIIFSEQELPALRARAAGAGTAAGAYQKVKEIAARESGPALTIEQAVGREGVRLAQQLEAMALVYQVEADQQVGRKAVELLKFVIGGIDPREFYREVDSDFFATEHWPKAFAFAWDWLFPLMTEAEREVVLKGLERWAEALYDHTESWWWADASYNCGAIPVGANGMLLTAIRGESRHPQFDLWFTNCFRKIRDNYFPLTWRANGMCNEGPGYAHYHKNPTQFAEAVRRTGGPDIIPQSGAVNAMHYLRHQWMPQGGCGPVGDNTDYGRRVFQSIYLHGIRELGDQAGLWTFESFTDFERINPILIFLFYPDGLEPVSPGALDLRTSFYFEFDRNRAGTVFSRSTWDDERASWFSFVTRYENANHTHYDMNSFLFTAFGEQFATHANIFQYSHPHHGVDFEHNMVIIDGGGMPAADRQNSAGDDGSIFGLLTGVGLGHFADYVRGDARLSYADRSKPGSSPALRANRAVLFAKQGPNPYVLIADDIQKDEREHDYHWQWYAPALTASGRGTLEMPFLIEGKSADCLIAFLEPALPRHEFEVVKGGSERRPIQLGRLRVNSRGVAARFLTVASAFEKNARAPTVRLGPEVGGNAEARSIILEGQDFRDWIVWQPENGPGGPPVAAGPLQTDALLAMVRTNQAGEVVGYLLGDGRTLRFEGNSLVEAVRPISVSADRKRSVATGPRRAREGLEPLPAEGRLWLPAAGSEVWVGDERVPLPTRDGERIAVVGPALPR